MGQKLWNHVLIISFEVQNPTKQSYFDIAKGIC
jgi:hypothetical protein